MNKQTGMLKHPKKVLDRSEAGARRIAENFVHPDDLLPTLKEDNQSDVAKTNHDKVTEQTKMKANISNN